MTVNVGDASYLTMFGMSETCCEFILTVKRDLRYGDGGSVCRA